MKKITKYVSWLVSICLVLSFAGGIALAKKELTTAEFYNLSPSEREKYKTIEIKVPEDPWLEEKQFDLPELRHTGNVYNAARIHSDSLFELAHPGVKVTHIDFDTWSREAWTTGLAGGTAAAFTHPYTVPSILAEEGMLADITDIVKNWRVGDFDVYTYLKENFWEGWTQAWFEGRCYAIPFGQTNMRKMEYRKDWFKEAGFFNEYGEPGPNTNWTFEDLARYAQKLTDPKKKRWGFAYPTDWACTFLGDLEKAYGLPNKFYVPDKSGKYTWRLATDIPQVKKMLQFIKDLHWKYNCVLTGVDMTYQKGRREDFPSGRVAMAMNDAGQISGIAMQTPDVFGPGTSAKDVMGMVDFPTGIYKLRGNVTGYLWWGFDPTLDKEHLKAAFDYCVWNDIGKGHEIEYRAQYNQAVLRGSPAYYVDDYITTPFEPIIMNYPGVPSMLDLVPEDYKREIGKASRIPRHPYMSYYGLTIRITSGAIEQGIFQSLATDEKADIDNLLKKAADIINSTDLCYKIKGDKEKFKAYYTALDEFYKENYPDWYKSAEYKQLFENYYKVW